MKKLVATILVVGALLIGLAPAFAEPYTSAVPARPDPNMAQTPCETFSDVWFTLGVGTGG